MTKQNIILFTSLCAALVLALWGADPMVATSLHRVIPVTPWETVFDIVPLAVLKASPFILLLLCFASLNGKRMPNWVQGAAILGVALILSLVFRNQLSSLGDWKWPAALEGIKPYGLIERIDAAKEMRPAELWRSFPAAAMTSVGVSHAFCWVHTPKQRWLIAIISFVLAFAYIAIAGNFLSDAIAGFMLGWVVAMGAMSLLGRVS